MNIKENDKQENIIKISLLFLLLQIIFNLLLGLNIPFLTEIYTFLYITFIPGLLLLNVLNLKLEKLLVILFSLGLSIFLIMLIGLVLTFILPLIGISHPLSFFPIIIAINLVSLILLIFSYVHNPNETVKFKCFPFNFKSKILFLVNLFVLVLVIISKFLLNNTGSNTFLLITIPLIGLIFWLVLYFNESLSEHIFPISLFLITLSLLLITSLSSNHVIGYDIHGEYNVFQKTINEKNWNPLELAPKDLDPKDYKLKSYYSCLAITILPTIYETILNINSEMVYKIIFQILFSFIALILYRLFKNKFGILHSFLAVSFIIIQSSFFITMTTLIRQEVAYLFFGLILLILFEFNLSKINEKILFFIFILGLILSHYTTSYIFLILLTCLYFFKVLFFKKNNENFGFRIILTILVLILGWYLITNINLLTAANLTSDTFGAIKESTSPLFISNTEYAFLKLNDLNGNINKSYLDNEEVSNFLNETEDISLKNKIDTTIKNIRSKQSGQVKSALSIKNKNKIMLIGFFVGMLTRIMILVGFFSLIFSMTKSKKIFNSDLLILQFLSLGLLAFMTLMPFISLGYNLERLYTQTLFFLAPLFVLGGIILTKLVYKLTNINIGKFSIVILVLVLHFLFQSNWVYVITNSHSVNFILTDKDLAHYISDQEASGVKWMETLQEIKWIYVIDTSSRWRIETFGGKFYKESNIIYFKFYKRFEINDYIFLSHQDLSKKIIYQNLIEDKNKIYSNNKSEIYSI